LRLSCDVLSSAAPSPSPTASLLADARGAAIALSTAALLVGVSVGDVSQSGEKMTR